MFGNQQQIIMRWVTMWVQYLDVAAAQLCGAQLIGDEPANRCGPPAGGDDELRMGGRPVRWLIVPPNAVFHPGQQPGSQGQPGL